MNYLKNLKAVLGSNINNIRGWKTNRKIVVFESDDWGSIRMPSREIYNHLLKIGWRVDQCIFTRYDSLASETDLNLLFDLLLNFRDVNGNHPIITANTIVANPDFAKIKESEFTEYHYEIFTKTLARYPEHSRSFEIMKKGAEIGVFKPQLHGREHTYVKRWMSYLKAAHTDVRLAFSLEMADVLNDRLMAEGNKNYRQALDYEVEAELTGQNVILAEAQKIFEQLFGYKSKSFIAPNYVWSSKVESSLKELGVEFIQSSRGQLLPTAESQHQRFIKHNVGDINDSGQSFLVRNCMFEPTDKPQDDVVNTCLQQISTSFRWKKPAIISTHRFNYIGYIDEQNRTRGLSKLSLLLNQILLRWPDVEFMTSDQLGKEIVMSRERSGSINV